MSRTQLETQGRLIAEDLDRQLRAAIEIGDTPTAIYLGRKAKQAIIEYMASIFGLKHHEPENHGEFYMGIPVREPKVSPMNHWTAHVSSLLPDGTVNR
jgi:hypothetical protein